MKTSDAGRHVHSGAISGVARCVSSSGYNWYLDYETKTTMFSIILFQF